ncbi:lipid-binding SYLF domain-containing protein [Acidisphaera sp. L21]|uniref:lipid-binding SYLF domain-containing protein n=1 Tax=Acidisphaera sp. L21 TaxID=1641851 RepID=UPI00131DDB94|nr:lipid-binding SYLF domain-containing protein [Acidisphaera sp. L21]
MYRSGLAMAFAAAVAVAPLAAHAQAEQQALVDRSTLAAQDLLNEATGKDAQSVLRRARAVMICPQVFRAGFLFGGQGGDCVLVARDGSGSWSSPAFYGLGSGSFGFQAGMQDSEVMMMILTEKGLRAVMDDQFKVGADAGGVLVKWGGGVEGATTGAVGADIVGFAKSRGLYAGISLSGSVMTTKSEWNRAYYGKEEAAQQIVLSMDANNPGASPLREVLGRYGASVTAGTPVASNAIPIASAEPVSPVQATPMSAPSTRPNSYPPVQRQTLPVPPRAPRY